ncbi:hypothetical protein [Cupriavidus necator]
MGRPLREPDVVSEPVAAHPYVLVSSPRHPQPKTAAGSGDQTMTWAPLEKLPDFLTVARSTSGGGR